MEKDIWISVEERKPDFAVEVKVKCEDNSERIDSIIPVGSYSTGWGGCSHQHLSEPTHWKQM